MENKNGCKPEAVSLSNGILKRSIVVFIFLALLFSLLLVLSALTLHNRFEPARYFSLFWGGQIIFIWLLFHNGFYFSGQGLVFISILVSLYSFGTVLGKNMGENLPQQEESVAFHEKRALVFLFLCFFISLANVINGIATAGFSLREISSFKILLELNNAAAVERYTGTNQSSFFTRISLIFVYLTPLLGGYLLPILKGKRKVWSYFSLLPSLLITVTQAVKSGLITSVGLWGASVIVASFSHNPRFFKLKNRTLLKISTSVFLFFSILFFSMILRTGRFDWEIAEVIGKKFINYAFGHLPAFDDWFTRNVGEIEPTFGVKTFYGVTNFLGVAERQQGVFSEFVYYGKNGYDGVGTNVFTVFRFIMEDFGLLGSMLAVFVAGTVSGLSMRMIEKRIFSLFFQTLVIAILFFISWSFVASVWAYTSYIATMVLFYFFMIVSFTKESGNPSCSYVENSA